MLSATRSLLPSLVLVAGLWACGTEPGGTDDLSASGGVPTASGGAVSSGGATSGAGGALASGGSLASSGGTSSTGGTTSHVGELVSKEEFQAMFPNHAALYSYEGFIAATAHPLFTGFAATGDDTTKRRELAAFFGNIGQETTGGWPDAEGGQWAWGLYYAEEAGCENGACPGYCQACDVDNPPPEGCFPCASGKFYHGRGPLQISYNFNYGAAGQALGVALLAQPELVSTDGQIAFEAALWFWMTAKSGGSVTCHDVMAQGTGFGSTIRVINGIECDGAHEAKIDGRNAHYARAAELLGVTVGDNLRCGP